MGADTNKTRLSHRFFRLGVWVKGLDGILEVIGGTLFLLASRSQLSQWVVALTQHELNEDPRDVIANLLRQGVTHLSHNTKLFGSIYLLVHGCIKIVLVAGLLRNEYMVYPIALIVLSGFILYQIYRLSIGFTLGLGLLTVLDVIIVLLIWNEYRYVRRDTAGA